MYSVTGQQVENVTVRVEVEVVPGGSKEGYESAIQALGMPDHSDEWDSDFEME